MVKLRRRTTGEMWEVVTVQSPNETSILTSPTQDFHESLHSLLLWLAHAESGRYAVDIGHPDTTLTALQQHSNTLTALQKELQDRQAHQASLQTLWSQLQPEDGTEESNEAREKLHVTGSKLKLLLKQVDGDLSNLRQRLDCESATAAQCQSVSQEAANSKKGSSTQREKRESSPPRSFFYRALRAAFPLQLLLLLLLLLPCLIPMSESDSTLTNNFARSFYPMLHYPNGPLDCNIPQGSILAICGHFAFRFFSPHFCSVKKKKKKKKKEVEGPWVNNRAEIPAGEIEMNPAQARLRVTLKVSLRVVLTVTPITVTLTTTLITTTVITMTLMRMTMMMVETMFRMALCHWPPAQYWEVQGGDQGRRRMMKKKMGHLDI
ncbi:nesprin-2 [Maylandia zebra]|uniref:nesprin-2 n=1 Tax=Maylandia zebra TaxID=106582 RepID=UPI00403CF961